MAIGVLGILVPVLVCVLLCVLVARAVSRVGTPLRLGPRRRFLLGALVAGLVVGIVLFVLGGTVFVSTLGLVQMLAPGVGALVVLVAVIASPGSGGAGSPRGQAELSRRGWASLGPAWLYAAPAAAAALMISAIVFFGASSSADEQGRQRTITVDAGIVGASSSPYPGWYYGLPALVLALVLLAATVLALARVAHHPLRGTADEREAARGWRAGLARVVMAVGTGSFLLYTGGMTLMAGITTSSVTGGEVLIEDGQPYGWDVPALDALGAMEVAVGLCAIVVGLFLCATALVTAARR